MASIVKQKGSMLDFCKNATAERCFETKVKKSDGKIMMKFVRWKPGAKHKTTIFAIPFCGGIAKPAFEAYITRTDFLIDIHLMYSFRYSNFFNFLRVFILYIILHKFHILIFAGISLFYCS